MKIVYWSDYSCPYCYIGEARLRKAIGCISNMEKVEVEMKSFQLDPTAGEHAVSDTQTRFAKKYGLSMEMAGSQIEHISEMGREEGLDFRYATTRFTNTMDAHRLTKLAQKKGSEIADRIIDRLFQAYFSENLELADHDLLQRIGVECGLPADEVQEVLGSDQYRDEVILDEREAERYGIHAVPFFVVAGKYGISGAQSVEGMKTVLRKALDESMIQLANGAEGMSCGPDGCRIGG